VGKYIARQLRRVVEERAGSRCEYCRIHRDDTLLGCEPDHIVAEKHGGPTEADNLALACFVCNRWKGSDLGSLTDAGELVRFFNPRKDDWNDHFRFVGERIEALTVIGTVTARIFGFNEPDRRLERQHLLAAGRLPSAGSDE
jgi:hypothetical protein